MPLQHWQPLFVILKPRPEQSPEDQAAEEAVQRASQWISQDVNQAILGDGSLSTWVWLNSDRCQQQLLYDMMKSFVT